MSSLAKEGDRRCRLPTTVLRSGDRMLRASGIKWGRTGEELSGWMVMALESPSEIRVGLDECSLCRKFFSGNIFMYRCFALIQDVHGTVDPAPSSPLVHLRTPSQPPSWPRPSTSRRGGYRVSVDDHGPLGHPRARAQPRGTNGPPQAPPVPLVAPSLRVTPVVFAGVACALKILYVAIIGFFLLQ